MLILELILQRVPLLSVYQQGLRYLVDLLPCEQVLTHRGFRSYLLLVSYSYLPLEGLLGYS